MIVDILNEQKEALHGFDFVQHYEHTATSGKRFVYDEEHRMDWKVKSALQTLLRAHFKVKRIEQIDRSKEQEARALVVDVLRIAKPNEQ